MTWLQSPFPKIPKETDIETFNQYDVSCSSWIWKLLSWDLGKKQLPCYVYFVFIVYFYIIKYKKGC